jgi:hypothetical protein
MPRTQPRLDLGFEFRGWNVQIYIHTHTYTSEREREREREREHQTVATHWTTWMVATMYSPCIASDAAVKAMNGRTGTPGVERKNTPPNH